MFIEEVEGSYVFENTAHNFNVYIDLDENRSTPYTIGYQQLEGDYEMIDVEDGPYVTSAATKAEAIEKAMLMMEFINLKLYGDSSE